MSEKRVKIPEEFHHDLGILYKTHREKKRDLMLAQRKAEMSKLAILNLIEESMPEMAHEDYKFDLEKMELVLRPEDAGGLGDLIGAIIGGGR